MKVFSSAYGSTLVFAAGAAAIILTLFACTPQQRSIVRSVVDLVDEVCGDADTVDSCLGKATAARAKAAAAADAGVADAAQQDAR